MEAILNLLNGEDADCRRLPIPPQLSLSALGGQEEGSGDGEESQETIAHRPGICASGLGLLEREQDITAVIRRDEVE